ncbi:MAG: formylglycine-generating enzyme family protein [Planctomycetes bacterium]|nr:formylglycine-generating enzyme family protein [Planctomycetota bacterium]
MGSSNQGKGVFSGRRARWAMAISVCLLTTFVVPAIGQAWGPGDADADADVDLDDFVILKTNFGTTAGATWAMGDFDGDGDVSLDDFVILKNNFGATYTYPDELTLDCGGGVMMRLVRIPAGTFMMGSPTTEVDRYSNEGPQHQVTISQPFDMGVCEVTQRQYQAVMGTNPSYCMSSGLDAPVETVSWNNAVAFCQTLSQRTGRTVMLPTEAQWEYACRAGSTTRFYYGDDPGYTLLRNYAWYGDYDGSGNSGYETHVVGQTTPNAWGLYDMHGNVWEWCNDWYGSYASANVVDPQGPASGSYRVLRGGGWGSGARYCRSANRGNTYPANANYSLGFRVVVAPGGLD